MINFESIRRHFIFWPLPEYIGYLSRLDYDENELKNQAHQIIYKSISEKLLDLHSKRNQFRDESERMYLDEHEKYSE